MILCQRGARVLAVIEPGNLERLRAGTPLKIEPPEPCLGVLVAYTPDAEWVRAEMEKAAGRGELSIEALAEIVERSQAREPVIR